MQTRMMRTSCCRQQLATRSLAAASGVQDIDSFAASVLATEVEARLRQVVGEALDIQRATRSSTLKAEHVAAAIRGHRLPVRTMHSLLLVADLCCFSACGR